MKTGDEFQIDSGRAIVWAVAPIQWSNVPTPGMDHTVSAWVGDVKVIEQKITYEEARGLNTVIGFKFTDALGCEFGFGALFARTSSHGR